MTVSSQQSTVPYGGNGVTTVFPVPFYFLDDTHLRVILRTSGGLDVLQVLNSDYTVSGAGNLSGGSITMAVPPATLQTLNIARIVPATQETDYVPNDPFPAESHERALDKLTMLAQQVINIIGGGSSNSRALILGDTDIDGSGQYRAKGNQIDNLGSAGGDFNNAANYGDVVSYVSSVLAGISGSANVAANVVYALPGGIARSVQSRLSDFCTLLDFATPGLPADGITDWQAVFEAAAASSYSSIYVPPGKYLLSAGNILVEEKKFWAMSGFDTNAPYGQTGAIIHTTQTTNPVFTLGDGGIIDGLQFFYPNQDGSTITDVSGYPTIVGAPIVYPPTIKSTPSVIRFELSNLQFINSYNCIEIGDSTFIEASGSGTLFNIAAYPIFKFLTIHNALAEISLDRAVLSPLIYQGVASTGDQKLRKWSQQNAIHFSLAKADGFSMSNVTALGARRGIDFITDTILFARFSNVLLDQMLQAVRFNVPGSDVTFDNCQMYGGTVYGDQQFDLVVFNSAISAAGLGEISFNGCQFQRAMDKTFTLLTANCVDRLSIRGCRFSNWASLSTIAAKTGAIGIGAAAAGVHVSVTDCDFINNNLPFGVGIISSGGSVLVVSDNTFLNCQSEIETSTTSLQRIRGNSSVGTQGTFSTALSGGSVIERNNVWAKPAVTKVTNEPWVIARQSTGQSTSGTTPLTMIYQTKERDGDNSFVVGTGTFTCKTPGSYNLQAVLTHAGGTAGDVFRIELVTTLSTYRKSLTMLATAQSVEVSALAADMRVGDTAFVRVTRLSGTGIFTTSAAGQENYLSCRLID